jgi:hypothetical protein
MLLHYAVSAPSVLSHPAHDDQPPSGLGQEYFDKGRVRYIYIVYRNLFYYYYVVFIRVTYKTYHAMTRTFSQNLGSENSVKLHGSTIGSAM